MKTRRWSLKQMQWLEQDIWGWIGSMTMDTDSRFQRIGLKGLDRWAPGHGGEEQPLLESVSCEIEFWSFDLKPNAFNLLFSWILLPKQVDLLKVAGWARKRTYQMNHPDSDLLQPTLHKCRVRYLNCPRTYLSICLCVSWEKRLEEEMQLL